MARCVTKVLAVLPNVKILKVDSDGDSPNPFVEDWRRSGIEAIELDEKDVSSVYPVWPPGVDWLTEKKYGWGTGFSDYEPYHLGFSQCNVKF
ncbi:hypothetical protein FA13DRAFT_1784163 [Coprinellus micaceus]|uniref:Uncharacterized protein n=1 Tax=Coprinellus micaceus TaxID=71717 RepID=A0A4Y7U0P9_COPMI|nr:hypothetical protein FA13DRAFT_1784163 [Coprinellus micaceus]